MSILFFSLLALVSLAVGTAAIYMSLIEIGDEEAGRSNVDMHDAILCILHWDRKLASEVVRS